MTLLGALGLLGWAFDLPPLRSVLPGLATMKANTALGFLLSGPALWRARAAQRDLVGRALAAAVGLLAATTLIQYLLGLDLGIDERLFPDPSAPPGGFPGRMSEATAAGFLLLSVGILALDARGPAISLLAALALGVLASVALTGYAYEVRALYRIGPFSSMALHTSAAFLLLAVGLLFSRTQREPARSLLGKGAGPRLLRRLIPWAIAIPFLTGWLRILGEQAGLFPSAFGTAVLTLSNIALLVAAVVWSARSVSSAEERFQVAVEASPSGMLMVDARGAIVLVNTETERLFGYARGELLGQPVEMLVPERVRDAHRAERAGFVEAPTARPMGAGRDLHGRRKDGSIFPLEIALNPVPTHAGIVILGSIVDITERKRQENELRRSNADLEQFAYVASHDLQEPLRMVASFTELLRQRYEGRLDEKADKYIHYAVDGAKRMQRLVADLLAYSRVGSQGKPLVPVAVRPVLERVLRSLQHSIDEAGAAVETPPELPTVLADEGQLHQLLQNLIANAIKFRSERALHVLVDARPANGRWRFEVRDNGIGIEPRYAERVFGMFQRLHERDRYDGSGIGLALVKRIVERHGGTVWLESEPDRGTSFFFTLQGATGNGGT